MHHHPRSEPQGSGGNGHAGVRVRPPLRCSLCQPAAGVVPMREPCKSTTQSLENPLLPGLLAWWQGGLGLSYLITYLGVDSEEAKLLIGKRGSSTA